MLKVIFTLLILFSQPINANDDTTQLECNKLALEINDHQVELGYVTKNIQVQLKTAELINLTNEKLIYAGNVAESVGDNETVSKIMGQLIVNKEMFKEVEAEHTRAIDRELELSTTVISLGMQAVEQECSTQPLSNAQILETCDTFDELEGNVNCRALRKNNVPEKKDEPKKVHPNTLEV